MGQPGLVAREEARHHLGLERPVERLGVRPVLGGRVRVDAAVADGPAVVAAEALRPPPVEDAQVDPAVDGDLLPGGAARLLRPARRVEPDVAALHEGPAHLDVVVLEEDELAPELPVGQREEAPHDLLPLAVGGVRLAGEQELHRPCGVGDDRAQPVEVGHDQEGPLVGGEAAGEADGEGVGVEERLHLPQLVGAQAVARRLHAHPLAHEADEPLLLRAVGGPQGGVGGLADLLPGLGLEQPLLPGRVDVLRVEGAHLRAHPARGVDAVRDVADGLRAAVREEVAPHRGGDLAVEPAHPVRAGREADREGGHVEVAVVRPEGEGLVGLAAHVADPGLEVLAHELAVEGLVAGGHRGVGGEDRRALHRGERLGQAVPHPHPLAGPLEGEEGHVALVHVPDRGVDAERAQGAHARRSRARSPGTGASPARARRGCR